MKYRFSLIVRNGLQRYLIANGNLPLSRPLASTATNPDSSKSQPELLSESDNSKCSFQVESDYTDFPEYPENVPTMYDLDKNKRIAQGRKILQQIIKDLPSVSEKIDFVNPYQRPWNSFEKRRHREWQRPLSKQRQAFALPAVAPGYDSLSMYKYVTKTHCVNEWPSVFDSINISKNQHEAFKTRLLESLKFELAGRRDLAQSTVCFIESLGEIITSLFSDDQDYIKNGQVGTGVRYESFLERGGFSHLYDHVKGNTFRIRCDNTYRIGELAFCFRDVADLQFRSQLPLRPFVRADDALNTMPVEKFLYPPEIYCKLTDPNPLWMIPGFDIGDTCGFGNLMINSLKNLRQVVFDQWKAENEEFNECLLSMAISSCFSWLNGQAHFKGFTQYTDILYPLATQAIFTDGRLWYFASYQLNTLDLLHDFDGTTSKMTNLCWYQGPFALYETFDQTTGTFTNVDDSVISHILKFVFNQPAARDNVENYEPYVRIVERPDTRQLELIEETMKAHADVKYSV